MGYHQREILVYWLLPGNGVDAEHGRTIVAASERFEIND